MNPCILKYYNFISADVSTIWENTYGCSDKYRCVTSLYLPLILAHAYNIIVYLSIGTI